MNKFTANLHAKVKNVIWFINMSAIRLGLGGQSSTTSTQLAVSSPNHEHATCTLLLLSSVIPFSTRFSAVTCQKLKIKPIG